MSDMLVKLYDLPPLEPVVDKLSSKGILFKTAIAPEQKVIVSWVERTFGAEWASECAASFANHPVSCVVAIAGGKPVGFACYDSTCLDFFGPTGVDPNFRSKGVGTGLLLSCLHAMAAKGYAYAIIGGAGPEEYYRKTVNAIAIEGSVPGIYRDMLHE